MVLVLWRIWNVEIIWSFYSNAERLSLPQFFCEEVCFNHVCMVLVLWRIWNVEIIWSFYSNAERLSLPQFFCEEVCFNHVCMVLCFTFSFSLIKHINLFWIGVRKTEHGNNIPFKIHSTWPTHPAHRTHRTADPQIHRNCEKPGDAAHKMKASLGAITHMHNTVKTRFQNHKHHQRKNSRLTSLNKHKSKDRITLHVWFFEGSCVFKILPNLNGLYLTCSYDFGNRKGGKQEMRERAARAKRATLERPGTWRSSGLDLLRSHIFARLGLSIERLSK